MLFKKQKLNFLIILCFLIIFCLVKPSFAEPPNPQNQENQQTSQEPTFSPEIEYPTFPGEEPTKSLPNYVSYIYKFAIGSAGFLAMLMLVIGGIRLIGAGGNPQQILKARQQILNSILGLGIILLSASILNIINPELLILKEASITEHKPETDFATLAKDWKKQHTPSGGGSSSSLYIGAVYDAGIKIFCYIPDKYTGAEDEAIIKGLVHGGAKGYACEELDGDKNHIFCNTVIIKESIYLAESKCEKICEIGSSCRKVEGYIDTCEMPATCAEVKDKGIQSECNDNYIYCLTTEPPPEEASSGGESGGGGSGAGGGEGGIAVGGGSYGNQCGCDSGFEDEITSRNNKYFCYENNNLTKSSFCAEYEVCYGTSLPSSFPCYSIQEEKCFCKAGTDNYVCLKYNSTWHAFEVTKRDKCPAGTYCTGYRISTPPYTPCKKITD